MKLNETKWEEASILGSTDECKTCFKIDYINFTCLKVYFAPAIFAAIFRCDSLLLEDVKVYNTEGRCTLHYIIVKLNYCEIMREW